MTDAGEPNLGDFEDPGQFDETGDGDASGNDAADPEDGAADSADPADGSADRPADERAGADEGATREGDATPSSTAGTGDSDSDTDADADSGFAQYAMEAAEAGTADGIGTVSVAQGLRVAEDDDETSLKAFVTVGNREDVRIGKYLIVPYPDGEQLFCRITALEYDQEFRTDDATELTARRRMQTGGGEFTEADYKYLAELSPVAVLFEDSGARSASGSRTESGDADLKRRMVDRVPKPGALVRQAGDAEQIKTGLAIPEDGVFLGHLSVGGEKVRTAAEPPTVDYRLKDDYADGDPLVFRHTLVAGGTGSGKTHGAKNVLRQYLGRTYETDDGRDARAAVVMFDPQDEYAQMHDDNPALDEELARRLERENVAYGGHDDTIALVPKEAGVSYPGHGHRAEQVEFTIPFSVVDEYDMPWLVAGASLNENQYPALLTLINRFFRNYDDGTYRQFLNFLDDPALKEELDETGRVHEATFDAVKRRVRSVPSGVFDQDATPITELDTTLVRPGGLTVVPTYHLSSARAKEMFVLAVSAMLVDDKLSNSPRSGRIDETPLVLGMDEAHNFLSGADNVQARQVVSKFTEAAKQGRKERLGLFLITQDPQDIADPVFKQVNTRLVLNLGDEEAIMSVNIPPSLAKKVPYMEKGQQVVYSPDNSEPVEVTGLPVCVTRHGE
ncbi:ATP-binding protein [Halobaculum magnesiiphilum]|uniref:ATP-binding protein n=1 Tax=Halobaculum magnesiiphilum TaxID=1017351 RepID=A0A8T8WC35_9EURY|nr:ATP-binding protein [Halobaculum magnesiiphilum]QZP37408.1 ATP-binding protein [Halobaculum magnesiiphilum]